MHVANTFVVSLAINLSVLGIVRVYAAGVVLSHLLCLCMSENDLGFVCIPINYLIIWYCSD